jgi:hypothetical protein
MKRRTYRVARKAISDENLRAWLMKNNPGFNTSELPTGHHPSYGATVSTEG